MIINHRTSILHRPVRNAHPQAGENADAEHAKIQVCAPVPPRPIPFRPINNPSQLSGKQSMNRAARVCAAGQAANESAPFGGGGGAPAPLPLCIARREAPRTVRIRRTGLKCWL